MHDDDNALGCDLNCELCVFLAFLKLRERRVILKYLAKLTEKIDSCTAAEQKVPEWCTKVCDLCYCHKSVQHACIIITKVCDLYYCHKSVQHVPASWIYITSLYRGCIFAASEDMYVADREG